MTFEPKKISEYDTVVPTGNTVVLADHTYANGEVVTLGISCKHIISGLPGPYADDTAAATANVAVGSGYYTSAGAVRIRVA